MVKGTRSEFFYLFVKHLSLTCKVCVYGRSMKRLCSRIIVCFQCKEILVPMREMRISGDQNLFMTTMKPRFDEVPRDCGSSLYGDFLTSKNLIKKNF